MLDEAVKLFPNVNWWIKADGVDVVSGLGESIGGKWSGDVDLNDGKVQQMYTTYTHRLSFVSELGLARRECCEVEEDLLEIEEAHKDDLSFLCDGKYSSVYIHNIITSIQTWPILKIM